MVDLWERPRVRWAIILFGATVAAIIALAAYGYFSGAWEAAKLSQLVGP